MEDLGPMAWEKVKAAYPRVAREALWMKEHLRFSMLPKPGLLLSAQPARFVVLLDILTTTGVLRHA